jgi:molybdopterin molybdotransferase
MRDDPVVSTAQSPKPLLSIDEALSIIVSQVVPLPAEPVPLEQAVGRFLASPVTAALDLPPFTNSAMDGYAIRAADTPGRLAVVGESAAGAPYDGSLTAGQAVSISTGGVLPDGADAVAQIEIVTVDDGGATIEIAQAVAFDEAVRHAGSDVRAGQTVLALGIRIAPAQIGATAAFGTQTLSCGSRPSVAIVTTGTELRALGEKLAPGEIFDSNGPMLRAAIESAGGTVTRIPAVADTAEAHREALAAALEHDVVISSGGVSVGPHDLVRGIGRELGIEELFWRIAMRPGKPLSFGVRGRTLVFGLPGNPVSTLVCFELFVRPALIGLQGATDMSPEFGQGTLATSVRQNPERDDLIRVRVDAHGNLEPLPGQQSHQIAITALSDGLARIPTGTGELPAGTEVAFLPLHGL